MTTAIITTKAVIRLIVAIPPFYPFIILIPYDVFKLSAHLYSVRLHFPKTGNPSNVSLS
jgi:hypothetical protein